LTSLFGTCVCEVFQSPHHSSCFIIITISCSVWVVLVNELLHYQNERLEHVLVVISFIGCIKLYLYSPIHLHGLMLN
jgi:hypothetical protein